MSKVDLDQFYNQQQESEDEDEYANDYIKLSNSNHLSNPFEAKPSLKQKSPLKQESSLQQKSKKHRRTKTRTMSSSDEEEDADELLAKALAKEEEHQRQLADYHLASQLQSKENNVLVPADEQPSRAPAWLSKVKFHSSKAPVMKSLPTKRAPQFASPPPPAPPPPPPLPSASKPQLHHVTTKELLLTQVKKATSRLTKKKLKPVKTVEKRAFPVGKLYSYTCTEFDLLLQ